MTTQEVVSKSADGLVCIQLDVHIWSGRRHLDKTDLIHANKEFEKLPEKDLANLGSVKICDPDKIKEFQSLKNRADAADFIDRFVCDVDDCLHGCRDLA